MDYKLLSKRNFRENISTNHEESNKAFHQKRNKKDGEIQTSSISYYITTQKGLKDINYKTIIEKKREIQNIVFSGFQKCCYQLQKFDSNPEKEFCEILEDSKEIISWLRINWDIGKKIKYKI